MKFWIPVEEKLPDDLLIKEGYPEECTEKVQINVVYNGVQYVSTGYRCDNKWFWSDSNKEMSAPFKVTHWAPLLSPAVNVPDNLTLYSKIEGAITQWHLGAPTTAGTLTRKILKLIEDEFTD